MEVIEIDTKTRVEFVDITYKLESFIKAQSINSGICIVFCPHTTAGLTINENADPSVKEDIISTLIKLIPPEGKYSHLEGNAYAHICASLMGSSLNIIIEDGQLVLGRWQGIYFCEFDGPRKRKLYIKVVKP